MYAKRTATNPAAFTLDYWKDHFALQAVCSVDEISGNVLDLGCGTGEVDILLAREKNNLRITGVDVCPEALAVAEKHRSLESASVRERISFSESMIEHMPFADNTFDACFISNTLEHVSDHGPIFRELYRVLKPQGTIVAIVPLGHFHDDPTHIWHFQPDNLKKHLEFFGSNGKVWKSPDGQQLAAKVTFWKKPKIIGMLRIKNEEQWILPTLEKASPNRGRLCNFWTTVPLTRTSELCRSHPKVIHFEYQNEPETDETRDKNRLLQWTLDEKPDWILSLDGDELLEDIAPLTIRREIELCPDSVTKLGFDFLYMWDSYNFYRTDGIYANL